MDWRVQLPYSYPVSCACASRHAACLFSQVALVIEEFLQNIISFSNLVPISLYVTIGNPVQSLALTCIIRCCRAVPYRAVTLLFLLLSLLFGVPCALSRSLRHNFGLHKYFLA